MSGPWSDGIAYPITALGKVCDLQLGKMLQPRPRAEADRPVQYLRAGSLATLSREGFDLLEMYASSREINTYRVVEGDLVVAEGGDCGQTALLPSVPPNVIIQNSLHRLRPTAGDVRFLRYALEAIYYSGWLDVLCNKATFGHLTREKLAALPIPNPAPTDQAVIADYLDQETARIDALVAAKLRLVNLLEERLQATVERLVWWEGDELRPQVALRRLASRIDVGIAEATTHAYSEDGVVLLRSTNIRSNALDLTETLRIARWFADRNASKYIRTGDILTVRTGNVGASAVVPPDLDMCQCFTQLITTLRAGNLPEFICYALNSGPAREYFRLSGWGSAQANISVPLLAAAPVPLVPENGQASGLRQIERATGPMARACDLLRRQVETLQERRAAFVAAAVTGELEIPEVAG